MSIDDSNNSDPDGKFRVLLIGANGQFGSKLAKLLASENSIELVLAGRSVARLEQLYQALGTGEILVLDRQSLNSKLLSDNRIDIVADLSGPYHDMQGSVVEAAIDAGVHYIDIADSRTYIKAVTELNDRASAAGCTILTGASSTPALSHAVVDKLTNEWQRIDSIEATISPSNSQDYGFSVIRGILDQVGKPMSVFTGGNWRTLPFWSATERRTQRDIGTRYTSLVDSPDNDLFVTRYQPVQSASFRASLELSLMHLGVSTLSCLVRFGLMRSAAWLAKPLQTIANKLSPLSNQYGGMSVQVTGRNSEGDASKAEWILSAKGSAGPHVPVLACLIMIRRLSRGENTLIGAHSCAGLLALDEFDEEFAKLNIDTQSTESRLPKPPFEIALGERYGLLPAVTQSLHKTAPSRLLSGEVTIEGATNPFTKMMAALFRMPPTSSAKPILTSIQLSDKGVESWARYFPGRCMRSQMGNPDPEDQTIDEMFGRFNFTLKLDAYEEGIDMRLQSGRAFGLPLPTFCLPIISASERADGDKHLFDVNLSLPLFGRLVHYSGWLRIAD